MANLWKFKKTDGLQRDFQQITGGSIHSIKFALGGAAHVVGFSYLLTYINNTFFIYTLLFFYKNNFKEHEPQILPNLKNNLRKNRS